MLVVLSALPVSAEWNWPALVSPPTTIEIEAVRAEWSRRDLDPQSVRVIATHELTVDGVAFTVRVIEFTLHRQREYVIAFIPPMAAKEDRLPVLVDIRDIRWDYPARRLDNGTTLLRALGESARRVILAVPSFRGEVLELAGKRYVAEGDRRDAWDGATDDCIAALTAVHRAIPQSDPDRSVAYGGSRGGGVALLFGARDRRIRAVASNAGPVDWFSAMARANEPWIESIARAWKDRTPRNDRAWQFCEWFLHDLGTTDITAARQRILAGSAVYFVETMPAVLAQYGGRDMPVPVANAHRLQEALAKVAAPGEPPRTVIVHPKAGHQLDDTDALKRTVEFLLGEVQR